MWVRILVVGGLCFLLGLGCSLDSQGLPIPQNQFQFPTAMGVSNTQCGTGACFLFVVSSNFDLCYNSGSLQTLDLSKLETELDQKECRTAEAPCSFPTLSSFATPYGAVKTGSYAQTLAMSPTKDRIYIPIKNERSVTVVDFTTDGRLDCGNNGAFTQCSDTYRLRSNTVASIRGEIFGSLPQPIIARSIATDSGDASAEGDYLMVGDESGLISLFVDQPSSVGTFPDLLSVQPIHQQTGAVLNIQTMRWSERDGVAFLTDALFNQMYSAKVAWDGSTPVFLKSFAYQLYRLPIPGAGGSLDTRDLVADTRPDFPYAYVLAREPASLLFVKIKRDGPMANSQFELVNTMRLGTGSSRITGVLAGSPSNMYLFTSSFNSGEVHVINADTQELIGMIRGFVGPYELEVDKARQLMYVSDFSASVVRVVDLAPLAKREMPRIIATLGTVRIVASQKVCN